MSERGASGRHRLTAFAPSWARRRRGAEGSGDLVPGVPVTSMVNAVIFGMGAITGVIAARSLGPSARGMLTIATIAPMYIALFGIIGLDEATVYLTGRSTDSDERATILWTGLALSVAAGLVAAAVSLSIQLGLYWGKVQGVDRTAFVLFALYPIVYCPAFIGLSSIRGYGRYQLWNVLRTIPAAGYLIGLTVLCFTPQGLTINGAIVCQGAALVGMLLLAAGWAISSHRPGFSSVVARALVGFGWRNHLITVQNLSNQRLDQLVLPLMVASSQVGMYSIAVTYAGAALSMGTGPSLQVFAHLSRDASFTREQFRTLVRRMLLGLLLVCCATWVAAPFVIPLVFGRKLLWCHPARRDPRGRGATPGDRCAPRRHLEGDRIAARGGEARRRRAACDHRAPVPGDPSVGHQWGGGGVGRVLCHRRRPPLEESSGRGVRRRQSRRAARPRSHAR